MRYYNQQHLQEARVEKAQEVSHLQDWGFHTGEEGKVLDGQVQHYHCR